MRSFPQSICHQCQGVKYTQSKSGSLFLMCTRTATRYPRQPLSLCHAFQELKKVRVELRSHLGGKYDFIFNVQSRLLIDLSTTNPSESIELSNQQYVEWIPKTNENERQDTISFVKHSSEQASLFRFELGHSLPDIQLCPPGSLFINQSLQIEWTSTAQRVSLLATLDCKHQNELIANFEEIFVNTDKMTFMH